MISKCFVLLKSRNYRHVERRKAVPEMRSLTCLPRSGRPLKFHDEESKQPGNSQEAIQQINTPTIPKEDGKKGGKAGGGGERLSPLCKIKLYY